MVGKKTSYWLQELSSPEIVERAKKCDIAILPLGSIEQHGPHLPVGHDTLQLFPLLERVAEKTGAMLLPCPWYGAHPSHHHYYPGTVPLQNDTLRALIKDVVRGVALCGYNKFLLFFGHGQAFATNYTVQELGLEGYFTVSIMFQNYMKDVHFDIMETPFWHAEETETSIGLYTHPDLVDMSLAKKGTSTPLLDNANWIQMVSEAATNKVCRFDEITLCVPEYKDKVFTGPIGDPTIATREKGEKYVTILADRLAEFIEHIKERFPAGVKPEVS